MLFINKQVPRGFVYFPALGWKEVGAELLISAGKIRNYSGKKHTSYVHSIKIDGKLLAIYAIFNGNKNRKDRNHINNQLNEILKRHAC